MGKNVYVEFENSKDENLAKLLHKASIKRKKRSTSDDYYQGTNFFQTAH